MDFVVEPFDFNGNVDVFNKLVSRVGFSQAGSDSRGHQRLKVDSL